MPFTEVKFKALAHTNQAKKIADACVHILETLHAAASGNSLEGSFKELQQMLSWYGGPLDGLNQIAAPFMTMTTSNLDWHSHELNIKIYDLYLLMRQHAGLGPARSTRRLVQDLAKQTNHIQHYADRSEARNPPIPYRVALYNLRSAHNAGSILRLADCMGLMGAVLAGYTPGPDAAGFQAASMGCEDWLPMTRCPASAQALRDATAREAKLIALELTESSVLLPNFEWPKEGGLLVLGNEELGLPQDVLNICDASVAIPMHGRKASLNVSTACAMALYDLRTKYAKL